MDINFYLRISGPIEYLPEGTKYEEHTITRADIDELIELDEMDQDVIDYLIEDEIAAWAQHWCTAIQITKEEYDKLKK